MPDGRRFSSGRAAVTVNVALGLTGVALIALAAAAGQDWADRHFLPGFSVSRALQIGLLQGLRVLLALFGLFLLLFVRPRVARAIDAGRSARLLVSALSATLAVAAAFVTTEWILRVRAGHATLAQLQSKEPLRQHDDLVGWVFIPSHHGQGETDGRAIDYATDRFGYRVARAGDETDTSRPTILFAGESIMNGYGLQWPETIPAQVQAMTGVPVANIAVTAHATDQTYMRLRNELPRFARPIAVVIPFVPVLFDRNLDQDRPYLDSALRWNPGHSPNLLLMELPGRVLRYRSTAAIDEAVAMTQAVLRGAIAFARSRGAAVLIVVPQYLPEEPLEASIRRRVLDDGHIPYLLVRLDPALRLAVDRHPGPRGATAIAAAISRALAARPDHGILR